MKEDVYSALRRHLDTFVLGAPEADAILHILRIRFTPEEAETALILGQGPEELSQLAQASGRNDDSLRSVLEQMADKALVLRQTKSVDGVAKELYSLLPTAVGLVETSFAKGERTPRTEQLARYWREYYDAGWGETMRGAKAPFSRIIPVETLLTPEQEVFSYERASDLVKEHDFICVVHCACREAAELVGHGCGKPTEVCLHFGDLAQFFVEKGYAREVSQTEAMHILDTSEKAGLVHIVTNSKQMGVAMCSCCTCCCYSLRAMPTSLAKSRFFAAIDMDKCIFCDLCIERCFVDAITFANGVGSVDGEKCHGCGLCATACPEEAIALKARESYQEPVETGLELARAMLGA